MSIRGLTNIFVRLLIVPILFSFFPFSLKAQLQADFLANKTGGCSPLAVSFINQTTGASTNAVYSWNFDNGNTAGFPDPGAIFKDGPYETTNRSTEYKICNQSDHWNGSH